MSVRMHDIAKELGISVSTVSLALRAAPQVAEETRLRVCGLAEQLGYQARSRQQRAVPTQVAFVTRDDIGNDFYGAVLSGAENECRKHHIGLHFVQIDRLLQVERMQYQNIDGLLVVGRFDEPTVRDFQRAALPMVLVDNNLPSLDLDCVLIENFYSLYRTTQYLYTCGHRAIAFLSGPFVTTSFKERLTGYRTAMADLGLPTCEYFFQDIDANDVAATLQPVCQGALPFTALIACNDKACLRAFHTLHDYGIQVPNDVSLCGFDDIDLASAIRPALTTNRVPRELLGQLAVQRLIERVREPMISALGLTVYTTLVERDSVRLLQPSHELPVEAVA